jgi:hypothetical protein
VSTSMSIPLVAQQTKRTSESSSRDQTDIGKLKGKKQHEINESTEELASARQKRLDPALITYVWIDRGGANASGSNSSVPVAQSAPTAQDAGIVNHSMHIMPKPVHAYYSIGWEMPAATSRGSYTHSCPGCGSLQKHTLIQRRHLITNGNGIRGTKYTCACIYMLVQREDFRTGRIE